MATLLSQLTKQPLHGPRIVLLLHRLLPPGLVAAIEVIAAADRHPELGYKHRSCVQMPGVSDDASSAALS